MNNFKIDQNIIGIAKGILSGTEMRVKRLEKMWENINEQDVLKFLKSDDVVFTEELIKFIFSYFEDMDELIRLKKTARSISFKIREFYGVKTKKSELWQVKFDKAKSLNIHHVISTLTGVTEFKYNISCPFHKDKGPSMKVYEDSFYCFSCSKGGSVVDFVMYNNDLDFKKAIEFLYNNF